MEVIGEFEKGTPTGPAVVIVVRQCGGRDFLGKVLAVRDQFWSWHLRESGRVGDPVRVRMANGSGADAESVTAGVAVELVNDWRCLCSNEYPVDAECLKEAAWLDDARVASICKEATFLQEMVCGSQQVRCWHRR